MGRDRESDIAADLFSGDLSRDPRETLATVSGGLQKLSEGGQITRYAVGGKAYLHISAWEHHQRIDKPAKGRYPLPTSQDAIPRETVATSSRDSRDTLAPGTGEQGNRGTEEKETSAPRGAGYPDDFLEFWKHYPLKKDKADALKAWRAATRRVSAEKLIAAVQAYRFNPDPKFVKHAATWLSKGSWEDVDEAPALPMFDVNKLPEPGTGWTAEQLDMVLGKDPWTEPEPPADLDENDAFLWLQQQRRRHFAQRVLKALEAIGRSA